ncbi:TIGR02444 family protein [Shinella sp. CPCC 100929]|uniref:TIGR02444 family protein n=1 Tax=Shinella lacus TaxID=2654216 RepID=A0ABT1REE0_9HYPH|nr:TIGR02444 family protein [Shinella lacus]
MRLWDFALDFYRREGVAMACLELQDRGNVDVNVLIHALWRTVIREETLEQGDIEAADAHVAAWREEVVLPLRAIRRRLKSGPAPAPDKATEKLRDRVKAAELDAEHIELDTLEAIPAAASLSKTSDTRQRAAAAVLLVLEHFSPGQSELLAHAIETLVDAI